MLNTQRGVDELALWANAMRAHGDSKHTVTRRLGTVRAIQRDTHTPLRDLDLDRINAWLLRFRPATKSAYFGDLVAYFTWCQTTGRLDDSPLRRVRPPKRPKGRPRPIHTDGLLQALTIAEGDARAWILLGAYQGLRVSEAAAVCGEDVSGGGLRVFGKGGSDKTIPLHPLVEQLAEGYPRRGPWFPSYGEMGVVGTHTIRRRVQGVFADVGVSMTFHQLRHWCGTELLRAGANLREVQEYLRHDSPTSTAIYTLVLQDGLAAAGLRLPSPGQPARDAA
jgi:integrase/recombinase XerD